MKVKIQSEFVFTLITILGICFSSVIYAEDIEQRRERVENMTLIERDELRGKLLRFESMSREDQQKYRNLHTSIENHQDSQRLKLVMETYYQWLKSLESEERAELQKMPMAMRVERIKGLIKKQENERFRELVADAAANIKPEDISTIRTWLENFIEKNKNEILAQESLLENHPNGFFKEYITRLPEERKPFILWFWSIRNNPESAILPQPVDIAELTSKLHQDTRAILANLSEDKRQVMLRSWVTAAMYSFNQRKVSDEELQKFYERLPQEAKDQFASLPPEEFNKKLKTEYLKRMYQYSSFRGPGGNNGRRPPFFGPPGRPPRFGPEDENRDEPEGGKKPRGKRPNGPPRRQDEGPPPRPSDFRPRYPRP